jgi:hypothetical protein
MTMRSTRRDFLGFVGGAGVGAVLSPFVPFLNREAEAADAGYPIRLLLVFSGNGSVPDDFWPTGTETEFSFKAGGIGEPLAPYKQKMIFPRNMRRVRNGPGGHESAMVCLWTASTRNPGSPFGGYSKNPSIDQIIAKKLPQTTAFPSLEFGVQHDGPGANPRLLTVMLYSGSDQPLPPESNPYKMLDRLMLGSATAPTGIRPEDLEKIRVRKASAVDLVKQELTALNRKIDRTDRAKLEQHLEGLTAIEKRLLTPVNAPTAPVAGGCGAPTMRMGIDIKANESYPELLAITNSLAVAALACNRTRVASLQWSRSFSMVRHTWVDVTTGHHTLSHDTSAAATLKKAAIERWNMQRMAELLKQLDGVPEGPGTMLDNTMMIYANELTQGAAHSVAPPITFVAGSAAGKLKVGRNLDIGPNFDFSQLMVTAAQVMGVTDVTQVGDLGKPGNIPALLNG